MADSMIEVDVEGAEDILEGVADRAANTAPLMENLSAILFSGVQDNFRREEGPGGNAWQKLAESTKDERRREGKWPGPILQRSRALLNSLQAFSEEDVAGVSTNNPYAAAHNFGVDDVVQVSAHTRTMTQFFGQELDEPQEVEVSAHKRHMRIPQREFMYASENTRTDMRSEVSRWLTSG